MKTRLCLLLSVALVGGASSFGQLTLNFHNDNPIYGPDGSPLAGSNYRAQLFAAPGPVFSPDQLIGITPLTSFRSGSGAGYIVPVNVVLPGITPETVAVTLQIRAWDTMGGVLNTWDQAQAGWNAGLTAAGTSLMVNYSPGSIIVPPNDPFTQVPSFSIYYIPEPGCGLLVLAGGAVCLAWRRRAMGRLN
jgi:hypothetical protein